MKTFHRQQRDPGPNASAIFAGTFHIYGFDGKMSSFYLLAHKIGVNFHVPRV